jgi:hypothetical protein
MAVTVTNKVQEEGKSPLSKKGKICSKFSTESFYRFPHFNVEGSHEQL